MYPPPTPVTDIGFDCPAEELFISMEKMASGHPLPGNVIAGVNPFNYAPSNLPEGIWYLIHSKDNGCLDVGFWKVKGEACKLFSNSSITGWRTTLEFFEGQGPHERRTDWLMHEYWITQKGPGENSKIKDASSLCRVFRQKLQKSGSLDIAGDNFIHSAELVVPNANSSSSNRSTSEHAVEKNDKTGVLAVTGESPNYLIENPPPELDYFPRGDYLELLDLDEPACCSSSSDNSSCLTMSSDEYFDSWALLREIDSESNRDLVSKKDSVKFSISVSSRTDGVVMVPPSPGSFISHEESRPLGEEILGTDMPRPASVDDRRNQGNVLKNRKAYHRNEGPSGSNDASTSSTRDGRYQDGERKAIKLRKRGAKKNKYMCFMPFYFLF